MAAHTSWYADDRKPSEEDAWYAHAAARGTSHWSVARLPDWLATAARQHRADAPRLIGVAPAAAQLPGYQTLGWTERQRAQADGAYVVDWLAGFGTLRPWALACGIC